MARPTYDQATRLDDGDLLAILASRRNTDETPIDTLVNLFESVALLAASTDAVSGWLDLDALGVEDIIIRRSSTGGAYALELDWSRDGATNVVTETVAVTNNTSVVKQAAARFVRVRVRNTDAVNAFTAHYTGVEGR